MVNILERPLTEVLSSMDVPGFYAQRNARRIKNYSGTGCGEKANFEGVRNAFGCQNQTKGRRKNGK
jgi:hypothetical protein